MNILDVRTLLIVSALLNTFTGVLFSVDALYRRRDAASRIWALAFISAFVTTFAYLVSLNDQYAWWALGVGNGSFVGVVGVVWSGCRAFSNRRPLLWVPGVAALVVAVFGAVRVTQVGYWGGTSLLFTGLLVFSVLTAAECMRKPMSTYRNATILTTIVIVFAAYTSVRLAVFLIVGPQSEPFRTYLGSGVATMVNIMLITGAAFTMASLRSEHSSSAFATPTGASDRSTGTERQLLELTRQLDAAGGVSGAGDPHPHPLVVVAADLDNLASLNSLFGRDFGDAAIRSFEQAIRSSLPADTAVASLGGLFIILAGGDDDDARFIVESIGDALAEAAPLSSRVPVRLSATYAWESDADASTPATKLVQDAIARLRKKKSRGRSPFAWLRSHPDGSAAGAAPSTAG